MAFQCATKNQQAASVGKLATFFGGRIISIRIPTKLVELQSRTLAAISGEQLHWQLVDFASDNIVAIVGQ